MPSNRLALPSGYRLENYQFTEALGKGGFGLTYLAMDLQLNRRVAVKELLPDSIATRVDGTHVVAQSETHEESWQWARDRFLTEAQVVAAFRHPNIVHVHRLIEANGTVYMVMDYLDGGSYEQRLWRIEKEPDEASMRAVIEPLLAGLEEVHAAGLLHRDIKPDNILFNHRGEPVLADFGAARELVGRTVSLTSIVTPGYSPFEQYQSRDGVQGAWTDIYALGAVMIRAITGRRPPPATDRLGKDELKPLGTQTIPGYSREFLKAVDLAVRLTPQERPQSVAAWRKVLVPNAKAAEPLLAVISPRMGEKWEVGTERKVIWKPGAVPGSAIIDGVDVELWQGDQLVEKIATGLPVTSPGVPWKISDRLSPGANYQIKLVARNADGEKTTTCAGDKFALMAKGLWPVIQVSTPPPKTPFMEKLVQFVMTGGFIWLVFLGGWRFAWEKAFPHLPQATISWVREQHPTWLPASEAKDLRPTDVDFDQLTRSLGKKPLLGSPGAWSALKPIVPTPTPSHPLKFGIPDSSPALGNDFFHSPVPKPVPLGGYFGATPTPTPGATATPAPLRPIVPAFPDHAPQ
jgi:serine/threonine protein kinase